MLIRLPDTSSKLYYGNNPKIQKLLVEVESELVEATKAAKSIAKHEVRSSFFKQPFFLSICVAVVVVIIFIIMYVIAADHLAAIPETHKTGFFSEQTAWEQQKSSVDLIAFMGFVLPIAIIGYGVYLQKNKKEEFSAFFNSLFNRQKE